jgi:hypothetical protein
MSEQLCGNLIFEVLTAVKLSIVAFWDLAQCGNHLQRPHGVTFQKITVDIFVEDYDEHKVHSFWKQYTFVSDTHSSTSADIWRAILPGRTDLKAGWFSTTGIQTLTVTCSWVNSSITTVLGTKHQHHHSFMDVYQRNHNFVHEYQQNHRFVIRSIYTVRTKLNLGLVLWL